MIRVVLHSEDRALQPLLSSALGKDFQVLLESTEENISRMAAKAACDVVLFDLNAKEEWLQKHLPQIRNLIESGIPAVIMADDGLRTTAFELVRLGAYGNCRRPPSIRDLKTLLFRAHEHSSLKRELYAAQQQLEAAAGCDRMSGSSPQMRRVYDLVRSVTNINASVLLTGESGTGKELIANAIHNLGSRAKRPFVAVSCGAIPETLIEAELFGHDKGAFTGTAGARVGYLEQAADGTLLLDEIGELSLATQVKLLRVLQQREFSRLGCSRLIPLRARLIFATHRDLEDMVAQGKFRQDLYYRINVMRIDAPSLREHPDDIPAISAHFLRQYSEMYQKAIHSIEPEAMAALQDYSWPGNVRELENIIQRAIILTNGDTITLDSLPANLQEEHKDVVSIDDYNPSGSFEQKIRGYKVQLAMTAVRENSGNKTLAARSLQISRAYLHRLLRVAEPGEVLDVDIPDLESA
jgi:DNA-binding NtrC family response regulator